MTTFGDGSRRKIGTQTQTLVHCNFGWGGSKDGYYVPEILILQQDPLYEKIAKGHPISAVKWKS